MMPAYCLETSALSHAFTKGEPVLTDVDLRVPAGSIYGFLGPNGAGKTTTLRLVLGLLRNQRGAVSFFGLSFHEHRLEILKRVGSLIESPSLYGHLTARENLVLLRNIHQCPPGRVQEALRVVGLPSTGNKKAGQFSLGMKQRLSIAAALLHSPSLLILDEPTNGLDPNGIIEIRELLRGLNREEGISIVISSHLLSEIERLVTHVGVIHRGAIRFQGLLDEFTSRQERSRSIVLETSDAAAALRIAAGAGLTAKQENGKLLLPPLPKAAVAELNRRLVEGGVDVYEIGLLGGDLESVFMELVNE